MYKEKYSLLISLNFILLAFIFLLNFSPFIGMNAAVTSIITSLLGFVFMLLHGYMGWGLRNILFFVVSTWVISFCSEALGVATGIVFGQYYYTDHLGPKILGVPLMIQVSYAVMGYASLMTARLILGVNENTSKLTLFFTTLIGALIMVGWDLCLDPYESTVLGDWIWLQGGPYFGIGVHNFVGWFITVFIFMFVYQLFAYYYGENGADNAGRCFWSQPLIYYAIMAIDIMTVPLVGGIPDHFSSPANYAGTLHDLVFSVSLITIFVMGTPCLIALSRLFLNFSKK